MNRIAVFLGTLLFLSGFALAYDVSITQLDGSFINKTAEPYFGGLSSVFSGNPEPCLAGKWVDAGVQSFFHRLQITNYINGFSNDVGRLSDNLEFACLNSSIDRDLKYVVFEEFPYSRNYTYFRCRYGFRNPSGGFVHTYLWRGMYRLTPCGMEGHAFGSPSYFDGIGSTSPFLMVEFVPFGVLSGGVRVLG